MKKKILVLIMVVIIVTIPCLIFILTRNNITTTPPKGKENIDNKIYLKAKKILEINKDYSNICDYSEYNYIYYDEEKDKEYVYDYEGNIIFSYEANNDMYYALVKDKIVYKEEIEDTNIIKKIYDKNGKELLNNINLIPVYEDVDNEFADYYLNVDYKKKKIITIYDTDFKEISTPNIPSCDEMTYAYTSDNY